MIIIFLGPPGAGKGTHAAILRAKLSIPLVCAGDIIRETIRNKLKFADELKKFTEKGLLVPDELVINIIKNRILSDDCKNGFILDGFPRTLVQALALEEIKIKADFVINVETSDEVICSRILGRRVCSSCGAVYNVFTEMKPRVEDICDVCGKDLIKRKDDVSSDVVMKRLQVYQEETSPLVDYYKNMGKILTVDGAEPLNEISEKILKVINGDK
ncbi:MAG: adenylate kinase [Candidatus Improbicoccus pseudotrichonymphae]|uniref:Adenylate kinase n=1 Tax=Candidatus Improbicoccus pseudotrichonymphae TaxID=3033792 RepID=A0AA48I7Q0_9FIRM|nr:MAG: adenylate kinase [Candidatus Improbicoccus pseudotrichonymphae]